MAEIIKPEKKPEQKNNEKFVDFLNLSPEQEDELKKNIEKSKGLVRIFMQPFFIKKTPHFKKERAEKIDAMNLALQKLLSLPKEKTPPILFFEEINKIPEIEENIREIGVTELKNKIYLVPTFWRDPEPAIPDEKRGLIRDKEGHWKIMNEKLKSLGVEKILIGGMEFNVYTRGRTVRNEPDEVLFERCMGEAIKGLSKAFNKDKIKISHLAFPKNRKEYEELKEQANKI